MAQSSNTSKRGLDALEDAISGSSFSKTKHDFLPHDGQDCFYTACLQAGVDVGKGKTSVFQLDDSDMTLLTTKRQFKILLRAYGLRDPRNHIQLVTNESSNFKSIIRGPFDLEEDFSTMVCTTMIHFFNKGNEWARYNFYSSAPSSSQFFHPTRFSSVAKGRRVKFPLAGEVQSTYVSSLDMAKSKASELLGTTPVFSLTAEPGTGKTTVLPFSFSSSRVAVVLPTGFDAWSAYKTASAVANLYTLTSSLDNGSHVTYIDSYSMAGLLFSSAGKIPYDIVIIDESDSYAGITKMLTELRIPDISVIHLSGTSGEKTVRSTGAYPIEKSYNFPPLHDKFFEAVEYIKQNSLDLRTLVMCPDVKVADQIHKMIANSKLITESSSIEDLEEVFDNQHDEAVIICDDSCTRGFNLNLDVVMDFQHVGPIENRRCITQHEEVQRMMRVGRNKSGVYHAPAHTLGVVSFSQLDVFRHNVARYLFSLPLQPCDLELDHAEVHKLAVSSIEPYVKQTQIVVSKRSSPLSASSPEPRSRSSSGTIAKKDLPRWALWAAGCSQKVRSSSTSSSNGSAVLVSGSDSERASTVSRREYRSPTAPLKTAGTVSESFVDKTRKSLVDRPKASPKFKVRPPPVDLSQEHDSIDWPSALADQLSSGDPAPFIIPYGGWSYTVDGSSSGVDYIQRLVSVIRDGPTFSKAEFEVICRGWNLLAARAGFSFSGGKDAWNDGSYLTFCLEYFHSFISIV